MKFFILFFTAFASLLVGNENGAYLEINSPIKEIKQIIPHSNGFILEINDCNILAQGMLQTEEGLFVLENGEWLSLDEVLRSQDYQTWLCPGCKRWNPQGTSSCLYCKRAR